MPCKDRRAAVCPSCSYLYKADAWILVSAGLEGGKSVPTSIAAHPRLFVTLTAPSFGAVHTSTSSGTCHRTSTCVHVGPCRTRHAEGDQVLGTPMCEECFDYDGAVLWNAACPKLWNRTIEWLKHRLAQRQGLTIGELRAVAELNYLRVAERCSAGVSCTCTRSSAATDLRARPPRHPGGSPPSS